MPVLRGCFKMCPGVIGNRIPAISVWQPWASLIAAGLKRHEFRTWRPPRKYLHRNIAIHAGMKNPSRKLLKRLLSDYEGTSAIPIIEAAMRGDLPMGVVLCVVEIIDVVPANGFIDPSTATLIAGNCFAWGLEVVERFQEPIPALGMEGFWKWTYNPAGRRAEQGALL